MTAAGRVKAPARVLIVDDHPLVRQGLVGLLKGEPGLSVSGEVGDVRGSWQALERGVPDLMIVDISLQDGDGLELVKSVRARYPSVRVLVLSLHDEQIYAERALRAGASGYVQKSEPPETILQGVHEVLGGRVFVSRPVEERLLKRIGRGSSDPVPAPLENLSDRELEVLKLMGEGLTTNQIAERLHLSKKTVQSHRDRLKLKLQLRNAAQLVRFAVESHLQGD